MKLKRNEVQNTVSKWIVLGTLKRYSMWDLRFFVVWQTGTEISEAPAISTFTAVWRLMQCVPPESWYLLPATGCHIADNSNLECYFDVFWLPVNRLITTNYSLLNNVCNIEIFLTRPPARNLFKIAPSGLQIKITCFVYNIKPRLLKINIQRDIKFNYLHSLQRIH